MLKINKIRRVSAKKAFTLMELVIVVTFTALFMIVLSRFFGNYWKSFNFMKATVEVTWSGGRVMTETSRAIRQADMVVASKVISGTTYTSGAGSLVLELPSIDSSGNILSGKNDYIVFYKSGSNIYMLTSGAAGSARASGQEKLSKTAQSLVFSYDNTDLSQAKKVDVDVQNLQQLGNQTNNSHLHQQINLYNKQL